MEEEYMFENVLAIVVLVVLVFGGAAASIIKYIAGVKQISCREAEAVEFAEKSYEKPEKMPSACAGRHVRPVIRKGEHAHGNV